jgi:hypothetical protein
MTFNFEKKSLWVGGEKCIGVHAFFGLPHAS